MPSTALTPDDIWSKRVTFLCIDTEVIRRASYQFSKGALNQLPHQLPDGLHLVLTPIIEQEVMAHRGESLEKAISEIDSAINSLKRTSGLDVRSLAQTLVDLHVETRASAHFAEEMSRFVERCNGIVLSLDDLDGRQLIDDYFEKNPPFEARKKSEFPDAATLQLLSNYADSKDTMGIVVSGDAGWSKYAAGSQRLFHVETLDELTALFVATGRTAEDVARRIESYFDEPDSTLRRPITHAIDWHVANEAGWDATELVSEVGGRLEVEVTAANMEEVSLQKDIEIWQDDEDGDFAWIVEVTADVSVELDANKHLYVWDGVDREEVFLGSQSITINDTIGMRFYVRLTGLRLDSDTEQWEIDVDIAPSIYRLSYQELEFDSH